MTSVVQLRGAAPLVADRLRMEWARNIQAILARYPESPKRARPAHVVNEIITELRITNNPLRARIAIAEGRA